MVIVICTKHMSVARIFGLYLPNQAMAREQNSTRKVPNRPRRKIEQFTYWTYDELWPEQSKTLGLVYQIALDGRPNNYRVPRTSWRRPRQRTYRRRSRQERKLRPLVEITLRQRHLAVGMMTCSRTRIQHVRCMNLTFLNIINTAFMTCSLN